jgi:exo-beta-1,3-glucanase (GH17 family)
MTEPVAFRTLLALLVISLSVIVAIWCWLATPVTPAFAPIGPETKLECVSYAPFRNDQTPHNPALTVSPAQIAEDLAELAKITKCIRTYSVDNGLDKVPELASGVGLKVLLGVWIGHNRQKNALLIETAASLARDYPGAVAAIVVGNEVLLRGDMTALDLQQAIRSVKARVNIPVTYADVWEFWQRYREIGDAVDFVTVHILPYWEDVPIRAEDAAEHVSTIHRQMAAVFPGKEILIGETGWPSAGRMRGESLPSRINQARVISEVLDLAKRENFRVNLIEAYDQPWKRKWEGSVGGYWGLLDAVHRTPKYPPGAPVSNYPLWKLELGSGLAVGTLIFAAAWLGLRGRPSAPRLSVWVSIAVSATTSGTLLGVAVDKMLYESYGFGGWLIPGLLLTAGIAAPLLSAYVAMSGRMLPTFQELIGPDGGKTLAFPTTILGFTLMVTTLIATQTALGFVFDPRWHDFPFAALTMAVVPFWTLALLTPAKSGPRPIAEAVFAGLLVIAALYTMFNEGPRNWQSLWTCAMYLLLGTALWRARSVAVADTASTRPVVRSAV